MSKDLSLLQKLDMLDIWIKSVSKGDNRGKTLRLEKVWYVPAIAKRPVPVEQLVGWEEEEEKPEGQSL